jgi:hypothetical protein
VRLVALVAAVVTAVGWSSTVASGAKRSHHVRRDERVRSVGVRPQSPATPTTPTTKPPSGQSAPPPPPLGHLQVRAREFSLTLSRTTLAAGRVAIELANVGQDPHDLRVERVDDPGTGFDFALTKSGARSTERLDLGAGAWKLYCTLPGHEEAGMHAHIAVAG